MKVYKTTKGYFYKEYKNGKKVRISKENYLKLKNTSSRKIIKKQKGGERPCIVCKRQGKVTNLDEKSGLFKTTPVKHRCQICAMRYDNENEKKKQVFCGKTKDFSKFCGSDLSIPTTCGEYHCKTKQWICNNCIKDYDINFFENNIQEILNKGNKKFTKIQSIRYDLS